jgi:predicted nucleic acid-binding Zn ribbon protein
MDESDFDFKSLSQEPENLSFEKLISCPHCGKPIPAEATMCLYCGETVNLSAKPAWVVWTAIGLIIIFLIFLLAHL